jgi:hypothetical protein
MAYWAPLLHPQPLPDPVLDEPKPAIGGGSPRRPWRQRPWSDPDGFAADAIPWKRHHVPAAAAEFEALGVEPAAEPPAVTVGRAGRDWTIAIAMPEGTEESGAGTLTLAANGPDGPVLWVYDVSLPGPAPAVGEADS